MVCEGGRFYVQPTMLNLLNLQVSGTVCLSFPEQEVIRRGMLVSGQPGSAGPNEEIPLGAHRGSLVLLTGPSDYVGGHLLRAFEVGSSEVYSSTRPDPPYR